VQIMDMTARWLPWWE